MALFSFIEHRDTSQNSKHRHSWTSRNIPWAAEKKHKLQLREQVLIGNGPVPTDFDLLAHRWSKTDVLFREIQPPVNGNSTILSNISLVIWSIKGEYKTKLNGGMIMPYLCRDGNTKCTITENSKKFSSEFQLAKSAKWRLCFFERVNCPNDF